MELQVRSPRYTSAGTIVCEILLNGDWVTFHATPDDPEEHGRDIFEACKGSAAPYSETTE